MREEEIKFSINAEEQNKTLVDLKARNEKIEADIKAYALGELMKVYEGVNPDVLKSLAGAGMDSGRLMAQAFQDLALRAEKIGNPDLLEAIVKDRGKGRS